MSHRPLRALAAALLALAALPIAGCTGTNAAVLTVTAGPSGVVRRLVVHISSHDGKHSDDFTVPDADGEPMTFPKSISLTFPSTVVGYLDVHVEGRSGSDVVASGDGFSSTPVIKGDVTRIDVVLKPTGVTPQPDAGGAVDLGGSD